MSHSRVKVLAAKPDDLKLTLGTHLVQKRTASCKLPSDLYMLGMEQACAHICSKADMAISLLLAYTGSARCHCYHDLDLCTVWSQSLWAEVL